jgi:hypothetical protein
MSRTLIYFSFACLAIGAAYVWAAPSSSPIQRGGGAAGVEAAAPCTTPDCANAGGSNVETLTGIKLRGVEVRGVNFGPL